MQKFQLPKVYPITDARLSGLSHAEQVEKLIAGGAKMIQLREKHASPRDFYAQAERALANARKHDVKIIINDRVDIALALKADGVHLGQDDLPPEEARKFLGDAAIIGYSTHSVEQALEAVKLPLDYIAIGAIFPTANKEKPEAILGLENLRQVRAAIGDFPLVAIGGIWFENAKSVVEAGADSVAIIGALLEKPESITSNTGRLINLLAV
jgi:thiamine-phosphate pyrophosphorylase